MTNAVIVSAARTAIGTARKGSLANTTPDRLAYAALDAAIGRSGFDPAMIDDLVLGESSQGGGVIARHVAIQLGLADTSGAAVNRHCASSLTALGFAAGSILSGMERVVGAGGVHSQSFSPRMSRRDPETQEMKEGWYPPTHPETPDAPGLDMSITVGWNCAKAAGLSREDMDAWAARSHDRALAAIASGQFRDEIVPITVRTLEGTELLFDTDEHPRAGTTAEKLATLKPLHPEIDGFSITAGNSSGLNDGAAALILAADDVARAAGRTPLARIRGWTSIGIEPRLTGLAVGRCVRKLADRAGIDLADVRLWEINEAFASVPLAACRELGLDEEKVNISGSGCSLGHPIAASGARMVTTLIHDLRRAGGGLGIAAMCAGGGMAGAMLIEV